MKFYSTRNKEDIRSFSNALFQGLAPDGGLYIPEVFKEILNINKSKKDFLSLSKSVISEILSDEVSTKQAEDICNKAFTFMPEIVELEDDIYIMELFHGPSSAFKDYGASFLASSMSFFLNEKHNKAVILTATSGDTGSAVAQAFYDKPNIDVVILYPSGRVSPLQEKQMTTLGKNIHAVEVKGSFDDCQKLVKDAFLSDDLIDMNLTSANSINLGRLIPQTLYFMYAAQKLQLKENLTFCVPSGNFGNLTAGLYAWKWGMKTKGFIAATNANDIFTNYLETGTYSPKKSVQTLSNAMDVGNPSNFERIQHLFSDKNKLNEIVTSYTVTDEDTLKVIKKCYEKEKYIMDPHTAVGYRAVELERKKTGIKNPVCILSTAHPAKFVETVKKAIDIEPDLPENLSKLMNREKKSESINNDLITLKEYLNDNFS